MKSFKQFLAESKTKHIENWIRDNCAPFLKECGFGPNDSWDKIWDNAILIRGAKDVEGQEINFIFPDSMTDKLITGFIKTVRKDRMPRDTNEDSSKIMDLEFEKKFGWKPRSQGLFCFGKNETKANIYGTRYRVFPIGNLKYIWSPRISDLTDKIDYVLSSIGVPSAFKINIRKYGYTDSEKSQIKSAFNEFIIQSYKNTDLKDAVKDDSEIMISCDKYLLLPLQDF